MEGLAVLKRRRAISKSKITKAFNRFDEPESNLEAESLKSLVSNCLGEIKILNDQISEIYLSNAEYEVEFEDEISHQTEFELDTTAKLKRLTSTPNPEVKPVQSASNGEGSSNMEYFEFITKFNNIVGLRDNLSKATKFT